MSGVPSANSENPGSLNGQEATGGRAKQKPQQRFCTICKSEFKRKEHLERHLLTHFDKRPYLCTVCMLDFNRPESLQRHKERNHPEMFSHGCPTSASSSPPAQTRIACEQCFRKKITCDKGMPDCHACKNAGVPCVPRYSKRQRRSVGSREARRERTPPPAVAKRQQSRGSQKMQSRPHVSPASWANMSLSSGLLSPVYNPPLAPLDIRRTVAPARITPPYGDGPTPSSIEGVGVGQHGAGLGGSQDALMPFPPSNPGFVGSGVVGGPANMAAGMAAPFNGPPHDFRNTTNEPAQMGLTSHYPQPQQHLEHGNTGIQNGVRSIDTTEFGNGPTVPAMFYDDIWVPEPIGASFPFRKYTMVVSVPDGGQDEEKKKAVRNALNVLHQESCFFFLEPEEPSMEWTLAKLAG